jgi:hypothetical protein
MGFVDWVTRSRHPAVMTDNEVIDEAALDGVELEERPCRDAWVWAGAAAPTAAGPATSDADKPSPGWQTG